jgi:hypothetical protein
MTFEIKLQRFEDDSGGMKRGGVEKGGVLKEN